MSVGEKSLFDYSSGILSTDENVFIRIRTDPSVRKTRVCILAVKTAIFFFFFLIFSSSGLNTLRRLRRLNVRASEIKMLCTSITQYINIIALFLFYFIRYNTRAHTCEDERIRRRRRRRVNDARFEGRTGSHVLSSRRRRRRLQRDARGSPYHYNIMHDHGNEKKK